MISKNLKEISESIAAVCNRVGRNPEEITLVAVSKNFPLENIIEANSAGQKIFGENKAQELRDKAARLANTDVLWHFIGHLQSNKAKYVVPSAQLIHSVDSLNLLTEINKQAKKLNKIQNVLLEIKTSGEATKLGLTDEKDILSLAEKCVEFENIELKGLMTMAPFVDDENIVRKSFKKLFSLFNNLKNRGFSIEHLSMGMTGDYHLAIEEGSTIIRIGTAIFGERHYK